MTRGAGLKCAENVGREEERHSSRHSHTHANASWQFASLSRSMPFNKGVEKEGREQEQEGKEEEEEEAIIIKIGPRAFIYSPVSTQRDTLSHYAADQLSIPLCVELPLHGFI